MSIVRGQTPTIVSGAVVNLVATQVTYTITALPPTGGMTLTMPTAAAFLSEPRRIRIAPNDQLDFTVLNQSSTGEVTLVAANTTGDMIISPNQSAAFRMLFGTASFILSRVGGTDSSGNIVTSDVLVLESSSSASPALRINASDAASGLSIDSGTSGLIVSSTGPLILTSSRTSPSITLSATDAAGSIAISTGTNGLDITSTGQIELDAGAAGITLNPSAGTKELGMFGTGPVTQRTTGNVSAPVVVNGSVTTVFEDSTWGGFTIQDIVGALVDYGLLA